MNHIVRRLFVLMLLAFPFVVYAQYTPATADWNRPVEPFRVVGNVYYVGASGVSAFLITTPKGHILIDTGFRETAPMVLAGITRLGFRVEDIRLLLASHAHYDHVGGMAEIKAASKARFLANPRDLELFARGGAGDFAFGDKYLFPPIQADGKLHDGQRIRLGGVVLTAHFTPGHTKGCTSYTTKIREGQRSYDVVFPCSMTAPGYQLVDNPKYPEIASDYGISFAMLNRLPCDIFLGGHAWDFGLNEKRQKIQTGSASNPFVDRDGYHAWLKKSEAALQKQLAEQRGR
jgi:metallo-beta-lactamase class B